MKLRFKMKFNIKQMIKKDANCNTNYRREMKLVPINMNYCLLQFYTLNIF